MPWLQDILIRTSLSLAHTPLGKLLAEVLEEFYDQKVELLENRWRGRFLPPPYLLLTSRRTAFITAAFSMLAKLAFCDRVLKRSEATAVNSFIEKHLELSTKDAKFARNIFQTSLRSQSSFQEFAQDYYRQFQSSRAMLENMVEILTMVAEADGPLSPTEKEILGEVLRIFRLPASTLSTIAKRQRVRARSLREADKIKDRLHLGRSFEFEFSEHTDETQQKQQPLKFDSYDEALKILGVTRKDSLREIKKKYRKLVLEYHPDRLKSKGLPDEFARGSSEKFREIQGAYDHVVDTIRQRGK